MKGKEKNLFTDMVKLHCMLWFIKLCSAIVPPITIKNINRSINKNK